VEAEAGAEVNIDSHKLENSFHNDNLNSCSSKYNSVSLDLNHSKVVNKHSYVIPFDNVHVNLAGSCVSSINLTHKGNFLKNVVNSSCLNPNAIPFVA
jgi:hypothetical protein